jgi:hypothetical protein
VVAWSTGVNRPNCEFLVLLWRFAATAWKRVKTSPPTSARTGLAASPWQRPVSYFYPLPAVSGETQIAVIPHPQHSHDLAPCGFFPFPKMKLKLKGHRFDNIEEIQAESQTAFHTLTEKDFQEAFQNWRRRWDRPVSTCGRELLRGWWWQIGHIVNFMIFTASVRNILDTPSHTVTLHGSVVV